MDDSTLDLDRDAHATMIQFLIFNFTFLIKNKKKQLQELNPTAVNIFIQSSVSYN